MAVPLRKLDLADEPLPLMRFKPRKKPKPKHEGHGWLWLHVASGVFIGGVALGVVFKGLALLGI